MRSFLDISFTRAYASPRSLISWMPSRFLRRISYFLAIFAPSCRIFQLSDAATRELPSFRLFAFASSHFQPLLSPLRAFSSFCRFHCFDDAEIFFVAFLRRHFILFIFSSVTEIRHFAACRLSLAFCIEGAKPVQRRQVFGFDEASRRQSRRLAFIASLSSSS